MPATDFRTNLRQLIRWSKLGLLGSPAPEVQRQRLKLLALAEMLGLPDQDMLRLKDHPLWQSEGPVDLTTAREQLREAKDSFAPARRGKDN